MEMIVTLVRLIYQDVIADKGHDTICFLFSHISSLSLCNISFFSYFCGVNSACLIKGR